jgi:hypothetical protein
MNLASVFDRLVPISKMSPAQLRRVKARTDAAIESIKARQGSRATSRPEDLDNLAKLENKRRRVLESTCR